MSTLLGRQGELLAQLREQLLILPSTSSPPANNKLVEPAVGPPTGAAGPGPPPPPPPAAVAPSSMAGGRRPRRLGRSSKRGRDDDEHHGEDPAAAAARRPRRHYCKRRKKKQQSGTSMVVTSAPDLFDGYQWRKYGQKQIEGAMYPRSYYRCTRSAEQGCAAKRTVQRNDDGAGAAAVSKYTVVRMGEHTCTANDSPEAPVILETTVAAAAVVLRPDTASTISNRTTPASSAAASCSTSSTTTTTTTATVETSDSPAISDNTGSTITSSIVSDGYNGGLFAAVNDNNDWVPARAASSSPSLVPTIEDFAGPIRSPVHISAADGWTIDLDQQFLLQLVNEPTICQHV